jgi:hypothetical protein
LVASGQVTDQPEGASTGLVDVRGDRFYGVSVAAVTTTTPGGGNWKLNLVDGQPVHVRLRGRDITARPQLISDLDQIETLLGVLVTQNPSRPCTAAVASDALQRS